ncbi:hypothetical protein, partial [Enterobacter intestinihominis]
VDNSVGKRVLGGVFLGPCPPPTPPRLQIKATTKNTHWKKKKNTTLSQKFFFKKNSLTNNTTKDIFII